MRCITAFDGFCHGLECTPAEDGKNFVFRPPGSAEILAHIAAEELEIMIQLGHAEVANMVLSFAPRADKRLERGKPKYSKVTILRADLTCAQGKTHLAAEKVQHPRARKAAEAGNLLLVMASDHKRFANSDITALGGAKIVTTSAHESTDMAHRTFILASMEPGSALRAFIARDPGQLDNVQYISNMALSQDGRELMTHG